MINLRNYLPRLNHIACALDAVSSPTDRPVGTLAMVHSFSSRPAHDDYFADPAYLTEMIFGFDTNGRPENLGKIADRFPNVDLSEINYSGRKFRIVIRIDFNRSFTVLLKPDYSIDQIYFTLEHSGSSAFRVIALGRKTKLCKDRFPELFIETDADLTFAILSGSFVIQGLPQLVMRLDAFIAFSINMIKVALRSNATRQKNWLASINNTVNK